MISKSASLGFFGRRSQCMMTVGLNLSLTNLGNALYAEFGNADFFRPEPKRNLTVSWNVSL